MKPLIKKGKVPYNMLTTNKNDAGIVFGMTSKGFKKYIVCKSPNKEGHTAIFGGSGSGKSAGHVIPTIVDAWNTPFVTIDIKGELKREYDKKSHKRDSKTFSLSSEEKTDYTTYDPYYFINKNGEKNIVQNVQELVQAIVPLPPGIKEPFWIRATQNFLTGCILYYIDIGVNFIDTMIGITTTPIRKLIDKIAKSSNQQAKIYVNHFIESAKLDESQMLVGILQEAINRLSVFASDPQIIDIFTPSENQIKWDELDNYNVFIQVPEDRLEQYATVITVMISQLIRTLERRPEMYSNEGTNVNPVLLMLDEFPRLGKMEVITSAISTLRSKKVTICLVMQSLSQLDLIYGEKTRRIVLENCSYKVILNADDVDSRKYFSELIGSTLITKVVKNTHYDSSNQLSGYSKNESMSRELMIQPHEFGTMKDVIITTPDGVFRIDKAEYHSETYKNYKSRELKPSIGQKVMNFIKQIPVKIKGLFNKITNLF